MRDELKIVAIEALRDIALARSNDTSVAGRAETLEIIYHIMKIVGVQK